ncbi:SRPBCC family protein [Archangium sp.]|uniref:SRPBCC family protein n=1 Tax=Archangium sp. TaxID=1872627 RepID=UPI002ED8060D
MTSRSSPTVKVQMMIRKPVAEVFRAFVDPTVTTRFWFTRSTGRLESGKTVRWDWEMYGASAEVRVDALEPDKRILVEWSGNGRSSTIEWAFDSRPDGTTLVRIENRHFTGTEDEVVAQALDATGGFSLVLAGLKAFLEHGIDLRLVADHHPDAHRK